LKEKNERGYGLANSGGKVSRPWETFAPKRPIGKGEKTKGQPNSGAYNGTEKKARRGARKWEGKKGFL